MIFVTADTHFGHKAAASFPGRNFKSLKVMHECMIHNWNSVISKEDTVYILGDFVFGVDIRDLDSVCRALNGRKMLILGNHDKYSMYDYTRCGVIRVYDYPILFNNYILLSHEPVLTLGNHGLLNVHGHTHGRDFVQRTNRHYCVCQECHNMSPIPFSRIYEKVGVL